MTENPWHDLLRAAKNARSFIVAELDGRDSAALIDLEKAIQAVEADQ